MGKGGELLTFLSSFVLLSFLLHLCFSPYEAFQTTSKPFSSSLATVRNYLEKNSDKKKSHTYIHTYVCTNAGERVGKRKKRKKSATKKRKTKTVE